MMSQSEDCVCLICGATLAVGEGATPAAASPLRSLSPPPHGTGLAAEVPPLSDVATPLAVEDEAAAREPLGFITCSGEHRHRVCYPDLNSYLEHNVLCQIYKLRFNRGAVLCPDPDCQAPVPLVAAIAAMRPVIRRRYQAIMSSGPSARTTGAAAAEAPPVLPGTPAAGVGPRHLRSAILECLSLQCPHCHTTVDPAPDACAAISCMTCGLFYCNCCFQGFGNYSSECTDRGSAEAHTHCATHDKDEPLESRSAFLPACTIANGQRDCRRNKIVRMLLSLARDAADTGDSASSGEATSNDRTTRGYTMQDIELGLALAFEELKDMNLSTTEIFKEVCSSINAAGSAKDVGASEATETQQATASNSGSRIEQLNACDVEEARLLLAQLSNAIVFRNEAAVVQLVSAPRIFVLLHPNTICPRQHETLFMLATMNGMEDLAVQLLERGGDISAKLQHGNLAGSRNALYVAAELGLCRLVETALSRGVSIDAQVSFESGFALRAMHIAAQYNRLDMIRLLVQHGAAVNVRCPLTGLTPLMLAIQFGHEDAMRELLQLGANASIGSHVGRLPLYMAIEKGCLSMVKCMVQEFRASIKGPLSSEPSLPQAIYLSVFYGKSFMIPDLVALGAEVNCCDASVAISALSLAALRGDAAAVKHLLDAGASPHSMSSVGRSAMFHAVELGHVEIIQILSERFPHLPNVPCKDSHPLEFPLHVAVTFKQTGSYRLLLRLGADPSFRNGEGLTAVELAARAGVALEEDLTPAAVPGSS